MKVDNGDDEPAVWRISAENSGGFTVYGKRSGQSHTIADSPNGSPVDILIDDPNVLGLDEIEVITADGATVEDLPGTTGEISKTWTIEIRAADFYATDHLGTTRAVYEGHVHYPDGSPTPDEAYLTLKSTHDYEPFGVELYPTDPTTNDRQYTGHERDESTGNDYMKFRFYGSSTGRFLRPDSIVTSITNPQGWNRYNYVLGNPVNLTDPTGHEGTWANRAYKAYAGNWWNVPSHNSGPVSWTTNSMMTVTYAVIGVSSGHVYGYVSAPSTARVVGAIVEGVLPPLTVEGMSGGDVSFIGNREPWAGDPVIGAFLYSLLVQHQAEISFAIVTDPNHPNVTFIPWDVDPPEAATINSMHGCWTSTVYGALRFASRTGGTIEALGHVEPDTPFSSETEFAVRMEVGGRWQRVEGMKLYQGGPYAMSGHDSHLYTKYNNGEFQTIAACFKVSQSTPIFVVYHGGNGWVQWLP